MVKWFGEGCLGFACTRQDYSNNVYEMVRMFCGGLDPYTYQETCRHPCYYCRGGQGSFLLVKEQTPRFRSVLLNTSTMDRVIQLAMRLQCDLPEDVRSKLNKELMGYTSGYSIPKGYSGVALARLTLSKDGTYHHAFTLPDYMGNWTELATRWLKERIPEIAIYKFSFPSYKRYKPSEWYSSFDPYDSPLASLKGVEGVCDIDLFGGPRLTFVSTIPSMTRFELLSRPNRRTGPITLDQWYGGNSDAILLRIGDRFVGVSTSSVVYKKYNVYQMNRQVADHLAIVSTMEGFTSLSVVELAVLISYLWAYAGIRLGPRMVSHLFGKNSAIFISYLLHTVPDPEMLTEGMRHRRGKPMKSQLKYSGYYEFSKWTVPQSDIVAITDLIRTQVGMPRLADEFS
jgi:hypothetical protein